MLCAASPFGLRFFPRFHAGILSIREVFPAVFAGHVVDVVEHELVVRAAQSLREQAPELTDRLHEDRSRWLLGSLYEGCVRHGDAV